MGHAKEIRVATIAKKDAEARITPLHYSPKTVNKFIPVYRRPARSRYTSCPSMDKSHIQGLVRDTPWNGFFELNRLVFLEALPHNSRKPRAPHCG
ncbi:hypothetical protein [Bradyrhizobium murdochi]|uniref:Mom family adenine methylcarbamoylation protein n=1 Tax=Bradyrhizobium murdochi TaxID=1038859 RepID=UPI000409E6D6|nr:hypothetical protein [Bradyrhizobium murdochi]